ncbi:MAG: thrombospondin type 3 repeat-containing protein [Panacagrimonas sp.]
MLKSWCKSCVGIASLALLAVTGSARAEETDNRWYVSPSIGGIYADGDFGPQGQLSFGRAINNYFGFEIEAGYGSLDVGGLPEDGKYERLAGGFSLLSTLAGPDASVRPFLLANVNGHSIDFLGESLSGGGVAAGGGLFIPMAKRWDLRLEARYNLDFITEEGIVPEDTFYVWTTTLGARFRFGADPGDDDGDGVPNAKDKCPDTPKGVQVYSDGCPIDLDQDGVPDYLDKCPNTPPGSPVDSSGCPFDSDGDGVPDHLDQCPGTPAGVKVDGRGCPLDSDGDGVPDYLDQCPASTPGTAVDARGCPLLDSDGDGIPDHLDKCPNSDPSIKVGPDGCPLDSDGDGIPDHLDECPNTPPGLKVLPNGCALKGDCRRPRPGEAVDAKGCALDQRFVLRGVKFEFDSDRLTKPAELILNDVADTMAAYPDVSVEVQGHTDATGTDAYNLGLSERRSNSVKRYLSGRGIPGGRMRPVGYGESAPIADNGTPEGQEENRRVEFKVEN